MFLLSDRGVKTRQDNRSLVIVAVFSIRSCVQGNFLHTDSHLARLCFGSDPGCRTLPVPDPQVADLGLVAVGDGASQDQGVVGQSEGVAAAGVSDGGEAPGWGGRKTLAFILDLFHGSIVCSLQDARASPSWTTTVSEELSVAPSWSLTVSRKV